MLTIDKNSLEVLAPAGSMEHIHTAIEAGADAVYIGIQGMSARPNAWSFDLTNAIKATQIVHNAGKRIYFAINAEYAESQTGRITEYLKQIEDSGCDALIVGDWGLLKRLKDMKFKIPVHSSTLLGVYNVATVQLLEQMGVHRVILSTNLFLDEITDLTRACSAMEFELIAYGGICFHDNHRCSLPHTMINGQYSVGCEFDYNVIGTRNKDQQNNISIHMPDTDLSSTLPLYIDAGIISFKIEGRTRSADYVAQSTTVLRKALDSFINKSERAQLGHYIVHPADLGARL